MSTVNPEQEKALMLQALMHAQYDEFAESNPAERRKEPYYNAGWVAGFELGSEIRLSTVPSQSEREAEALATCGEYADRLAKLLKKVAGCGILNARDEFDYREAAREYKSLARLYRDAVASPQPELDEAPE